MLGQCLVVGAAASGTFRLPVVLVILSAYSAFIGLEGFKRLRRRLQTGEAASLWDLPRASRWFLVGAAGAGLLAVFGFRLHVLLFWGLLSLLLVALHTVLLFRRQERSVSAEWLGILGITLSAGVAWSAGSGRMGREAFLLWGVCFLYFAGSVPYIKLRVRQMRKTSVSAGSALLYSIVALACVAAGAYVGAYRWLMTIPFALLLAKILWVTARGKAPRTLAQVGYAEVFYSTVFTVMAIISWLPTS